MIFGRSAAMMLRTNDASLPLRLQYELFSKSNPFVASLEMLASWVRENRSPAAAENPFLAMQESASRLIVATLDGWRDLRDSLSEWAFLSVYGSQALQAAFGIDPAETRPLRKAVKSPLHRQLLQSRIADLRSRITTGGLRECAVRGMLYAGMGRGD